MLLLVGYYNGFVGAFRVGTTTDDASHQATITRLGVGANVDGGRQGFDDRRQKQGKNCQQLRVHVERGARSLVANRVSWGVDVRLALLRPASVQKVVKTSQRLRLGGVYANRGKVKTNVATEKVGAWRGSTEVVVGVGQADSLNRRGCGSGHRRGR